MKFSNSLPPLFLLDCLQVSHHLHFVDLLLFSFFSFRSFAIAIDQASLELYQIDSPLSRIHIHIPAVQAQAQAQIQTNTSILSPTSPTLILARFFAFY
jgi:hypothetical protein